MLSTIWNDIRYSIRTLARNPGVAALAIVTIALGIGVNAGILTTVNGLLFRDLPAVDAHELVTIEQSIEGVPSRVGRAGFSTTEYRSLSEQTTTLSGVFGNADPTRTTLGGESPQEIVGTIVTCEYFDVLRQPPAMGRALRAEDCATGADPVVVLAHELWSTTFEADPGVVGRTIELNRQLFTVVGVAQEGTYGGLGFYRTQYFAPISTQPLLLPNENSYGNDNRGWLSVIGRRAASIEQVRSELAVIAAQIDSEQADRMTTMQVERATPLGMVGFIRDMLVRVAAVLMIPFALVLLIACANVANLLLARATARNREIAIRFSLGASRVRVIRQLLIESVLISVAGGVLGTVLALWAFQALAAVVIPTLTPAGLPPFFIDATPDFRVIAVMAAVMLGTGVLFGLAPAFQVSKPDLHSAIKQGGQGTGSRRGGRLQGTLVGVQVAMTMVLMVGVGLLLRGLTATQTIDPGFDLRNVVVASYDLPGSYDPEEAAVFQPRLLAQIQALPGVAAAAQAISEPLNADTEAAGIRLPTQDRAQIRRVDLNVITPDYFDVLGIPIARGRAFEDADMTDSSVAAIITESTARNLWPGREPIGQRLLFATSPDQDVALEIVGVTSDAQVAVVGQVEPYYLYLPAAPRNALLLKLLVRSRTDFASMAVAIRAAAERLDPGLAVRVSPLEANLDYWQNLSGTLTGLAGALGLLALTLGAVGIYGVVAYFVGRRTREIAIRVALGARPGAVLAMVLRRTMRPVVVGAVIGLAAAVGMSRVLSSVLFGVSPFDPIGIGVAGVFVLGIAVVAGLLPGRSAVRQPPLKALHYE
ncbi:MAG TPA: ABC transporter permease [Gammaproteobacteria bacterium]|nr:ABC transporter permease [Gammaproteobacteria bacterium]